MDRNVVLMSIDKIQPHPKNAKLHPKEQVEKIAGSIRDYGFNNPILIDSDYTILAGHGRFQAAKILKLDEVPVICLDHLSPEQARAYMILDNKSSESGYDVEILTDELFELSMEGIDAVSLGFSEEEWEKLTATANSEDEMTFEQGEINVSPGQRWKVGRHEVIVGGRKLNAGMIAELMEKNPEKMTLILPSRTAQSIISCFEGKEWQIDELEALANG